MHEGSPARFSKFNVFKVQIFSRKTQPAWRKVRPHQLEYSQCFRYQRTVADDHTVNFEGALFQIPKKVLAHNDAGKRINVHVLLDGSVEFFFKKNTRPLRLQNGSRI